MGRARAWSVRCPGLDTKTAALVAGASEDEITGVLLAIAPVIGLGRMVGAAPGVAGAFGYDIEAALEDRDDH